MANLTEHFKTTKHLLDSGEIREEPRPYLGLSGVGHSCSRYIWYSFRWAYPVTLTKRQRRLFDRGHREEDIIIALLKDIGYEISGQQKEIIACNGHVKGHIDGIIHGVIEAPKTDHLAEFKTMKDSKFKELKKKGSIKQVHPVYYAQSQMYMHYLKLIRTLFIVVNKNDDDIYIERIHYNKDFCETTERKIFSILLSEGPPPRPFTKTYYECKWCDARTICHDNDIPETNCRTCQYVELEHEGQWSCGKYDSIIPLDFQRKGCDSYKLNEALVDGT